MDEVRYWMVKETASKPLDRARGSKFAYSNLGHTIAGVYFLIITVISAKSCKNRADDISRYETVRPLAKVVPSAGDDFRINQVCRKQIDLLEISARHQVGLRIIAFHLGVQPYGEKITMSAFERLLAIADEETLDLARAMIGKPELALLLAKEALKNTTEVLSPTAVAEVLGISRNGATNKIENCAISERPAWDD